MQCEGKKQLAINRQKHLTGETKGVWETVNSYCHQKKCTDLQTYVRNTRLSRGRIVPFSNWAAVSKKNPLNAVSKWNIIYPSKNTLCIIHKNPMYTPTKHLENKVWIIPQKLHDSRGKRMHSVCHNFLVVMWERIRGICCTKGHSTEPAQKLLLPPS